MTFVNPEDCKNDKERASYMAWYLHDVYEFRTLKDSEEILIYQNGIYKPENGLIAEHVEGMLNHEATNKMVREVKGKIARLTLTERSEFDKDPDILNLDNGFLSMKSRKLQFHNKEYLSMVQLPLTYDTKAGCPAIAKFLRTSLRPIDVKKFVRMLGYVLMPSNKYDAIFFFVGVGSNGKSVMVELIKAFVGAQNCSTVSLQELVSDKFAKADLFGKMVNAVPDLPPNEIKDGSVFRSLSSMDRNRAQFKYKNAFTFQNRAKMIFSANRLPKIPDEYASLRRIVIIEFPRVFTEEEKDPELLAKLTTESELSGLLNVALAGQRALESDRGFNFETVQQVQRKYQTWENDVKAFVNERCFLNGKYSPTEEIQNAYVNFCIKTGRKPLENNILGAELAELGVIRKRRRLKGVPRYFYEGITLKTDLDDAVPGVPG